MSSHRAALDIAAWPGKITRQVQRERRALCAAVRDARERAGLTQRQLADKLGWPHRTIQRIESGERRLTVEELFLFADALGTTAERLLKAVRPTLSFTVTSANVA